MRVMFPYRLLIGSTYNAKTDDFDAVVHHMTFYAADKMTLMYLITAAECQEGRVISAFDVQKTDSKYAGPTPKPLAN